MLWSFTCPVKGMYMSSCGEEPGGVVRRGAGSRREE